MAVHFSAFKIQEPKQAITSPGTSDRPPYNCRHSPLAEHILPNNNVEGEEEAKKNQEREAMGIGEDLGVGVALQEVGDCRDGHYADHRVGNHLRQ